MLANSSTQDEVGRRQELDWHSTRTSAGGRTPLRLMLALVGRQAGVAVEVVEVVGRLLGHLLHLVDGDGHPGGHRLLLLLLPSRVVVPAVGQLRVRTAYMGHRVRTGVGWVGLEEVVRVGFGASVKWSRTLAPSIAGLEGSY